MHVNELGDIMSIVAFQRDAPLCVLLPGECLADEEARPEHNEQPGQMGHTDPN